MIPEVTAGVPAILFWGVLTFSLIVVVHEFGHFAAARLFGVRVHEFMIGLPGPSLRWERGRKTDFGITAIPLGGYVRIAGMEPGEEDPLLAEALWVSAMERRIDADGLATRLGVDTSRASALLATLADYGSIEGAEDDDHSYLAVVEPGEGETAEELLARERRFTYRGKKTWQRIVMLVMGVVLNLLFAVLTFTLVLSLWGVFEPTTTVQPVEGGAAARAGIEADDRIVSIGGDAIEDWLGLQETIQEHEPGETVAITVERDGRPVDLSVEVGENEQGDPFLGVTTVSERRRFSPFEAVEQSVVWIGLVFVTLAQLFNPETFSTTVQDARGVVGISVEAASAAGRGPIDYAWLVALLSLSLGAINIFPIPPLDGGRIAVELIERVMGRPIKREISLGISAVGAVLIFGLIGYILYLDIIRYVIDV